MDRLAAAAAQRKLLLRGAIANHSLEHALWDSPELRSGLTELPFRSEERRVGKEGRSLCDWSSDVCSSDLGDFIELPAWMTHRHENLSGEDAYIASWTDWPLQRLSGNFYYEEL